MKKIVLVLVSVCVCVLLSLTFPSTFPLNSSAKYVILTFDDGGQWFSDDRSVSIMDEFGYRGVLYVPIETYEWQGTAIYQQLKAKGWEIGSHTWTHARLDQLSTQQLTREIADSKTWLEQNFNVTVVSLSYPHSRGEVNQTISQALSNAGYVYARGDTWSHEQNGELPRWTGEPSFKVTSYPITHQEPGQVYLQQIPRLINDAQTYGFAVAMFHRVNEAASGWGGLTPSEFRWCLEQIRNTNLQVITFQDLLGSQEPKIINVLFQPLNMIWTYIAESLVFNVPQNIMLNGQTWCFTAWNDGYNHATRTLYGNTNYTLLYEN